MRGAWDVLEDVGLMLWRMLCASRKIVVKDMRDGVEAIGKVLDVVGV